MGVRLQYHINRKEGWVRIFTEGALEKKREGLERSKYLPDLVEDALKSVKADEVILDSETVWYAEGHPLPRHEMVAVVGGKEVIKGEDIRAHIFDIPYLNGEPQTGNYEERLKLIRKVLPEDSDHFRMVETIEVKGKEGFYKAFERLSRVEGSEGMMIKTPEMPAFSSSGRTSQTAKIKVLFEYDLEVIGIRKMPAPKPPKEKVTAEQMEKLLPSLLEKSSTYTLRVAFKGPDGKLWPVYSDKTYAPGDLELKWDEARAKWRGTEDPRYWKMAKGVPNSEQGAQCYGNTYNIKAKDPHLGDIISVAPVLVRIFKDKEGKLRVSHTFPRVSAFKPEATEPDDWKVVNSIARAVARRHGLAEPKLLLGGEGWGGKVPLLEAEQLEEISHPFTSPGGKVRISDKIVKLIPLCKTFIEPFAGGAAVFFAKEPSEAEVVSDVDPDIIFVYKFLQDLTESQISKILEFNWTLTKEQFEKLEKLEPKSDIERFYRTVYLKRTSYGSKEEAGGFAPSKTGRETEISELLLKKWKARLQGVKLLNSSYKEVINQFDSPDSFFYCDPPYPGHWPLRKFSFDESDLQALIERLRKLKGKFILSVSTDWAKILPKEWSTRRVGVLKSMPAGGPGHPGYELLSANFPLRESTLAEGIRAPFGSPGGKRFLASRIVKLIPEHKTYMEPYFGGGAVFFAKEPSEREIINDLDKDIFLALTTIQTLKDSEIEELSRRDWGVSAKRWEFLKDLKPVKKVDRLYRFLYVKRHSYGGSFAQRGLKRNRGHGPAYFKNLQKIRDRLKGVEIHNSDASDLIPMVDTKDTFFYMDPPYHYKTEDWMGLGNIDLDKLLQTCKKIEGKFILSLNDSSKTRELFKDFHVRRVLTLYAFRSEDWAKGGKRYRSELLISNFKMPRLGKQRIEEQEIEVPDLGWGGEGWGPAEIEDYELDEPYEIPEGAIPEELVETEEPSHEKSRELAAKVYGDPYMVEQPADKKSDFVIQYHLRGIWTERERKDLSKRLEGMKTQDELEKLWRGADMEYLLKPVDDWKSLIQKVDDARKDITVVLNKYLTRESPTLDALDLKKIVNRGNIHADFRAYHPTEDYLVGWTLMVVRLVIQFLESGELVFPLRDRLLENKLEDKWTVAPKARQPETWATLVTPKRPTFEAEKGEVAATVETGGRILYKTAGKLVFGCNKDDYHEYFLWLDKPYEHLSGRYGLQLLAGRAEYLKIPREKGEPPQQWWMMDKVWKTPAPYIMTHNREKEEAKARREGLKRIIWNANVIPILLADPVLKQTLEGYTKEQIDAKVKEFSKDKGEWNKK